MPSAGCVGSLCRAGYLLTNALLDLYAAGRPDERALTQIRRIARYHFSGLGSRRRSASRVLAHAIVNPKHGRMQHAKKNRQAIRHHPLGQRLGRRRLYRASGGRTVAGDGR